VSVLGALALFLLRSREACEAPLRKKRVRARILDPHARIGTREQRVLSSRVVLV
jgi:hypothetical protein